MTTHYLLRRLHSLSGIVPVGVFLVVHLWTNAAAAGGRASFDHAVGQIQAIPGLPLVELFGIALPLAFHALYGVFLALRAKGNVRQYPYPRNWMFTLQRVTGFVAFAFIALHVAQLRVPKAFGALPWTSFYGALQTMLGEPGMFGVYLIGVTACVVHFANGLWGASQTWGLASTPRASRRAGRAALALGVLLWLLGLHTLLHFFWRCGGLLPLPAAQRERACRDGDLVRRENSRRDAFTRAGHFPYTTERAPSTTTR
jgi:succinate dehydrogenase / fumarate reductase, cytochrome b subunit